MKDRIDLDWTRLLGFDQITEHETLSEAGLAKAGLKPIGGTLTDTRLAAKSGSKPILGPSRISAKVGSKPIQGPSRISAKVSLKPI